MRCAMANPASQADGSRTGSSAPGCAGWQAALAEAVTDPTDLCRELHLPLAMAAAAEGATEAFPLFVPRTYLARIRPSDPNDPILLQILPRKEELASVPQFTTDPVGETHSAQGRGWLRKYRNRLLMVTNGGCGVHCRFCFRRHFPYDLRTPSERWEEALHQLARDPTIHEVILSGGDPLTLDDSSLAGLARRLAEIPHVRRLRVHTRLPIVVPQRVNDELLGWLGGGRLAARVVVHVNHPAEIDEAVGEALTRLVEAGIPVLSQSVLLGGVNDRVEVLASLFERLADLRVMPYYLHQLDRVAGAAHFEVPEHEGIELVRQLRTRLPGYAVPRYVRQPPSGPSKLVLA